MSTPAGWTPLDGLRRVTCTRGGDACCGRRSRPGSQSYLDSHFLEGSMFNSAQRNPLVHPLPQAVDIAKTSKYTEQRARVNLDVRSLERRRHRKKRVQPGSSRRRVLLDKHLHPREHIIELADEMGTVLSKLSLPGNDPQPLAQLLDGVVRNIPLRPRTRQLSSRTPLVVNDWNLPDSVAAINKPLRVLVLELQFSLRSVAEPDVLV
jgi:hypothetical protein